jgi:ABC-type arginine/histidine transport system permease subunit
MLILCIILYAWVLTVCCIFQTTYYLNQKKYLGITYFIIIGLLFLIVTCGCAYATNIIL